MKVYLSLFLLGAFYVGLGVFFSTLDLKMTKEDYKSSEYEFYDYSGVLNVHSLKSNGSGKVQDIISAAAAADLDFIIFNESDSIGKKQPRSIKFGNVHVFYGAELNYRGSNFLHSSIKENFIFSSNSDAQLFVSNYLETDGEDLLILSHPNKSNYDWDLQGPPNFISGVEVLNLREAWRKAWEQHTLSFLSSLIFYPFNSSLFFLDIYSDEALASDFWDEWGKDKNTPGFLGSDVTSKLRVNKKFHLNFPGYKRIFLMAQNHVLLTEELSGFGNHKKIFSALKKGQSYFSLDLLGDPKGFAFWGLTQKAKFVLMGESVELVNLKKLLIQVPAVSEKLKILLYHNGKVIKTSHQNFEFLPKEKGSYRVEVRVNPYFPIIRKQEWIPWIFSNSIFIKGI